MLDLIRNLWDMIPDGAETPISFIIIAIIIDALRERHYYVLRKKMWLEVINFRKIMVNIGIPRRVFYSQEEYDRAKGETILKIITYKNHPKITDDEMKYNYNLAKKYGAILDKKGYSSEWAYKVFKKFYQQGMRIYIDTATIDTVVKNYEKAFAGYNNLIIKQKKEQ